MTYFQPHQQHLTALAAYFHKKKTPPASGQGTIRWAQYAQQPSAAPSQLQQHIGMVGAVEGVLAIDRSDAGVPRAVSGWDRKIPLAARGALRVGGFVRILPIPIMQQRIET